MFRNVHAILKYDAVDACKKEADFLSVGVSILSVDMFKCCRQSEDAGLDARPDHHDAAR